MLELIKNFHTSFSNSSIKFCELFKLFKATFLFASLLTLSLKYNGPSFHIAEYTVEKPPLPISLIFSN
jgi:hypothetical protein